MTNNLSSMSLVKGPSAFHCFTVLWQTRGNTRADPAEGAELEVTGGVYPVQMFAAAEFLAVVTPVAHQVTRESD